MNNSVITVMELHIFGCQKKSTAALGKTFFPSFQQHQNYVAVLSNPDHCLALALVLLSTGIS